MYLSMNNNGNKWYKDALRGLSGIAVLAAYALCVIGATGTLVYHGSLLFAAAEVVVSGFAFVPVRDFLKKTIF